MSKNGSGHVVRLKELVGMTSNGLPILPKYSIFK